MVGNAKVAIMDGAYAETLGGVVLGKDVNLQVIDADMDMTDGADILKATVEVYREKTQEEINAESAPGPCRSSRTRTSWIASRRSTRSTWC